MRGRQGESEDGEGGDGRLWEDEEGEGDKSGLCARVKWERRTSSDETYRQRRRVEKRLVHRQVGEVAPDNGDRHSRVVNGEAESPAVRRVVGRHAALDRPATDDTLEAESISDEKDERRDQGAQDEGEDCRLYAVAVERPQEGDGLPLDQIRDSDERREGTPDGGRRACAAAAER